MSRWLIKHGDWWMLQECFSAGLSYGVHIDWHRRVTGDHKQSYGPYVDIHYKVWILSFGRYPYRSIGEDCYR
ncbi:MAG TPA: hypothetical protein VMW24_03735 [Sedimentisphaerales bacterium]|nr:hypothetical protein [Sedimentisphaerales bacterium]